MAPFSDKELQVIRHEVIRWGFDKNKTVKETALALKEAVQKEMKRRQEQGKVSHGDNS